MYGNADKTQRNPVKEELLNVVPERVSKSNDFQPKRSSLKSNRLQILVI